MISYPFNSILVDGSYDRAIDASMERAMNKMRYTNGVFASPADGLMVKPAGGMNLTVNIGGANVEGVIGYEPNIRSVILDPASATLPRRDRVVLRLDDAESIRSTDIYKKIGVPATTPYPPDLTRQPNYYELCLAEIYVPEGATEITDSNIKDTRPDPSLCGMVVPAIPYENQTAELWNQIKDSIDLVNSALDVTVAGNLQNQIDGNKTDIEGLQTQVRPIPLGGTGATTAEQAIINLGVADFLKAVKIQLTVDAYWELGTVTAMKLNNIVVLTITNLRKTATPSGQLVGTLPVGYRPKTTETADMRVANASSPDCGRASFTIGTNGDIRLTSEVNMQYGGFAQYIFEI